MSYIADENARAQAKAVAAKVKSRDFEAVRRSVMKLPASDRALLAEELHGQLGPKLRTGALVQAWSGGWAAMARRVAEKFEQGESVEGVVAFVRKVAGC